MSSFGVVGLDFVSVESQEFIFVEKFTFEDIELKIKRFSFIKVIA